MAKKAESLDFEITLLEGVLRRDESDARIIELLASLYTEVGRYDEGLCLDRRHVKLEPKNPTAHYNLACSLALKKEFDEALASMRTALECGFNDLDWAMKDPDLKDLRCDRRFHALLQEFQVRS